MILTNQTETLNYGKELAKTLQGGEVLCLYGNLGAGKTTLTKGITLGLGIEKEIKSPTFGLMNVYDIKTLKHKNIQTLVHIDTYRLKDELELVEIGALDYLGDEKTVCIIEWPEKIDGLLNEIRQRRTSLRLKKITIKHLDNDTRDTEVKE